MIDTLTAAEPLTFVILLRDDQSTLDAFENASEPNDDFHRNSKFDGFLIENVESRLTGNSCLKIFRL